MKATANAKYKKLDISKLKNRGRIIASSGNALRDITPIKWSDDVLDGTRKIIFCEKLSN